MIEIYIIMLIIALLATIYSNISMRTAVTSYVLKNKYVKNKFLLAFCIIPPKEKILMMPYINYIIQVVLFISLISLYMVDWIKGNNYFITRWWIYAIYLIIALIFISLSQILDKWNHKIKEPNLQKDKLRRNKEPKDKE